MTFLNERVWLVLTHASVTYYRGDYDKSLPQLVEDNYALIEQYEAFLVKDSVNQGG